MYKKRLFERIMDLDKADNYVCSEHEQIESILNYLKNLLAVRRGSCVINKDFGMDSIFHSCDESFSSFISNAQEELQEEISLYEPRLEDIHVIYDGKTDNHLYYKFRIEANLVGYDNAKINLNTVLNFDGSVVVNEE